MFAIYIFTFMYNSLVENGIKKKINEHSTSKYFVTIGIYRYISNKSLQFAVFFFIKIFHAKTFLNKLMKNCLLLLKTLECIVFRGQLIQWLLFQKSNYTSLIQLQSKLLQVIKFESYYIFFTQKKYIFIYIKMEGKNMIKVLFCFKF